MVAANSENAKQFGAEYAETDPGRNGARKPAGRPAAKGARLMAFDGTDQCWVPDIPVARDEEWRMTSCAIRRRLRAAHARRHQCAQQKWSLTLGNREKAELHCAMLDLLRRAEGQRFPVQGAATGVIYNVFCDAWRVDWDAAAQRPPRGTPYYCGTLSAEFVKANGVTADGRPLGRRAARRPMQLVEMFVFDDTRDRRQPYLSLASRHHGRRQSADRLAGRPPMSHFRSRRPASK